MNEHEEGLASF